MSKRIGKYKVGGKNQALSTMDGAVIQGNLSGIANLTTTGTNTLAGATNFGVLRKRQKVTQLVDLGGSGGALTALTLQTAQTADKIINAVPDGDGTVTKTAASNEFRLLAEAEAGAGFSITMISATAGIAFLVHDLAAGIAANTGEYGQA